VEEHEFYHDRSSDLGNGLWRRQALILVAFFSDRCLAAIVAKLL
jgi:hypothetical protein